MKRFFLVLVSAVSFLMGNEYISDKNPIQDKEGWDPNTSLTIYRNLINKANFYYIRVEKAPKREAYEVRHYPEDDFVEYILQEDLIDRVNEIIKQKIMLCRNENKVIVEVSDKDLGSNDISCLMYPRSERLIYERSKSINPNELLEKENPISDKFIDMVQTN